MGTVAFIDEVMEPKSLCPVFAGIKPQTAELKPFERVKTIYPY